MRLRSLVLLLLLLVAALAGAAWAVLRTTADGRDGSTVPATVAVVDEGPDGESVLHDSDGRPLRRADGTAFPVGTRRVGRSVRTPDGRMWRRVAGSWVTDGDGVTNPHVGSGDGGERRRVDVATVRADRATRDVPPDAEGAAARAGARGFPGSLPPPLDIRFPPETTVLTSVADPTSPSAAPDWQPADGTIAPSGVTHPRLDVFRDPESAAGRARDRIEDDRAAAETAAVVAQNGLRGDYFDVLSGRIRDVPDVSELTPSFSRIDLAIDFATDAAFALPFEPETFVVRWTGWLIVPASGDYTFTCGSDDGARLSIGDREVFAHRSLRPYAETSGTLPLEAGRHAVELMFYENEIYASCRLYWQGPGVGRSVVPSSALAPPDSLAGVLQPHVARIDPASARVGDLVTISGVGLAPFAEGNAVTIAGVPAEVVGVDEDTLSVRVPLGAETGAVTVRVGDLTSLPRAFTVDSLNGLFAEYFLLGRDLDVMPDLDVLTPYFVRLDGPLDYHQDLLWNLPYEPDVFAARYRGFLYVPADDEYRITLGSDDGARMAIDGVEYLAAPGLHSYREVERTTQFTQGFHPIEITFFENRGVARLRLFWQRPDEIERRPVPRGFLFPPEALASAAPPVIGAVAAAGVGETITIEGSGFGNDPSVVCVRFSGDAWARPSSVEPTRLTAVVPRTAGSGPLRVDVGVLSSNAVDFARTTPVGLTADVYVFAGKDELAAATTPEAYADRAPNLTRVEAGWRRDSAAAWDLPFPVRNVAIHWHGTLGVDTAVDLGWMLQADDGARLYVDGRLIVDNGPFHGLRERYGKSTLQPGDHRFDLWYFQAGEDARLHLFWNPWGLREHRDVPATWFRPD